MNQKGQNIQGKAFWSGFFASSFNRVIIVGGSLTLAFMSIYYLTIPDLSIFPNNGEYVIQSYNDAPNGGNSVIFEQVISDTSIHLGFELREGFIGPYVGLSIERVGGNSMNIAKYNTISIATATKDVRGLSISLYSSDATELLSDETENDSWHQYNLTLDMGRSYHVIHLDQFKIPDWWYDQNQVSEEQRSSFDLTSLRQINIGTSYTPQLSGRRSLDITAINFSRDNSKVFSLIGFLEVVMLVFLVMSHFFRQKLERRSEAITVEYKSVVLQHKELNPSEGFMTYINEHFHDSELTLELVSEEMGINQRKIAQYIQDHFGCNFKTYVNRIRIEESKRLLSESQLNIGEIAYKVGFSNQSHFNRVFKSLENTSPSKFKEGSL
jgi:AraC-like DNA-binding protein